MNHGWAFVALEADKLTCAKVSSGDLTSGNIPSNFSNRSKSDRSKPYQSESALCFLVINNGYS